MFNIVSFNHLDLCVFFLVFLVFSQCGQCGHKRYNWWLPRTIRKFLHILKIWPTLMILSSWTNKNWKVYVCDSSLWKARGNNSSVFFYSLHVVQSSTCLRRTSRCTHDTELCTHVKYVLRCTGCLHVAHQVLQTLICVHKHIYTKCCKKSRNMCSGKSTIHVINFLKLFF